MMHITISQWRSYVNDELTEIERTEYENHLYECDQCLASYMEVLAESEGSLPELPTDNNLTDTIFASIDDFNNKSDEQHKKVVQITTVKKKRFYESTLGHYIIAAAMTLILMASGLFSSMTNIANSIEQPKQVKQSSLTEQILNKTLIVFDELDGKLKDNNLNKNQKEVGK